jgi:RNA polymerase sigma-70 factor (ECF subfamily)
MRERETMKNISDRDLVLAFQRGDVTAYDEIYRRHATRVRHICVRMLGNPSDAEEAAQEVFLRGYRALGRFNGSYQVGAWLARIATNMCLDILRSRTRSIDADELPDEDREPPSDRLRPDLLVAEQMHLSETLSEILPLHQKALVMQAVEGMSHKEMAGELEMTPQQVKSLLHRARSSFRRVWQHASVFVISPVSAWRSLATRGRGLGTGFSSAASPVGAMTAERMAAGAVAAVLAVGGLASSEKLVAPSAPPRIERRSFDAPAARSVGAEKREHVESGDAPMTDVAPEPALAPEVLIGGLDKALRRPSRPSKEPGSPSGSESQAGPDLLPLPGASSEDKLSETVDDLRHVVTRDKD